MAIFLEIPADGMTSRPERSRAKAALKKLGPLQNDTWPKGEPGLRLRVVIAVALVAAAKGINVIVPIIYKMVVDVLSIGPNAVVVVPVRTHDRK